MNVAIEMATNTCTHVHVYNIHGVYTFSGQGYRKEQ